MQKVKWILSPDTFGENLKVLHKEIIKQGHEYIDIEKYFQFRVDGVENLGDTSQPTIFYGSIESGQHILRHSKVYPGVYCNLPQFKCSYYYPRIYKYLLNQHHVFLPFGLLKEKKEWLFDEFGQDRAIFIRPDDGYKTFTGQTLYKEDFDGFIFSQRSDPESLVVVAEPLVLREEYRLIVDATGIGNTITGSMYKNKGKLEKKSEEHISGIVLGMAAMVAGEFKPDNVYAVDIAMTSEGPRVIEVNSFSCSGLYKSNIPCIVQEVSDIVIKDWEEIYG